MVKAEDEENDNAQKAENVYFLQFTNKQKYYLQIRTKMGRREKEEGEKKYDDDEECSNLPHLKSSSTA